MIQQNNAYNFNQNFNPNNFEQMIKRERKIRLRTYFSKIGFSLILSLVILYVLSICLPFIGGAIFSENLVTYTYIVSALASILSFISAGFFCGGIVNEKPSELISFRRTKKDSLIWILIASFSMFMISNYMTNVFLGNMEFIGLPINQTDIGYEKSWLNLILYCISIAVVPALTEEFLFRGIILGTLRKYGDSFAIVTSSLFFGLMHQNFIQLPFAFVGGLVFGYITVYTGSVVPAMVVHFANNLFSCIFSILPKYINSTVSELLYIGIVIVALVAGIFFVYKLSANDSSLLNLKNFTPKEYNDIITKEKEKYIAFFQSFGVIAFVVLLLGLSIINSFFTAA